MAPQSLTHLKRQQRHVVDRPCRDLREEHIPMPNYRFGKHPPKLDYRTLRFKTYLAAGIAPPPASFDVLPRVYTNLGTTDPSALFPMDGNDTLGDCTIAALAH